MIVGCFALGLGVDGLDFAEKLRVRSGKTRWGLDLGFRGGRKGRGVERKREESEAINLLGCEEEGDEEDGWWIKRFICIRIAFVHT